MPSNAHTHSHISNATWKAAKRHFSFNKLHKANATTTKLKQQSKEKNKNETILPNAEAETHLKVEYERISKNIGRYNNKSK